MGDPSFGVMAADGYAQDYNDTFDLLSDLNAAIEAEGCILCVIGSWGDLWPEADPKKIGQENYYGTDWQLEPGTTDPEVQIGRVTERDD